MGKIELINGDCMDYMKDQPDKSFDLAIVDPPYGIGVNHSIGRRKGQPHSGYKPAVWDKEAPEKQYFDELRRLSKNQIIWGTNHFADKFDSNSACWLVWDKVNGSSDFADCELAYTSFNSAVRRFVFQWAGMLQADMKNKEHRIHPTQKPMRLYQWVLENYSEPGQRILDTHLGSGSSAIAAHYFGVDFVGIEIDEDYYKAAVERFNNETAQEALF